ncbi:hypothetical protein TrST_g10109 [Triparma strigata]|uniref:PHD-type domain-containing protein n=1 Tax=Triparma strigata TaxID=1606541 RepID=A0A9W7A772_9STRA|nr:hypothetical protein TrST_g10109 [Triparma strigata]
MNPHNTRGKSRAKKSTTNTNTNTNTMMTNTNSTTTTTSTTTTSSKPKLKGKVCPPCPPSPSSSTSSKASSTGTSSHALSDITCVLCGSGSSTPSNDILLCDGPSPSIDCPHGETFHQLCTAPPTFTIPRDSWSCPSCTLSSSPSPPKVSDLVKQSASRFLKTLKSLLSQIRFSETTIEAYTSTSKSVSLLLKTHRMPLELLRASTKLEKTKLKIRDLILQLDSYIVSPSLNGDPRFQSDDISDDSGVNTSDVICTLCRGGECEEGNDIIMCDGKACFRAFHVECVGVEGHESWGEEEDWQCVWCELRGEGLEVLNEYFPVGGGCGVLSPRSPGGGRKVRVRWEEPGEVFEGQEEVVKEKERREEEGWDGDLIGEGGGESGGEWETFEGEDEEDESDEDFVEGQKEDGEDREGEDDDDDDDTDSEEELDTFKIDKSEINQLSDVDSDAESEDGYGLRRRAPKPLTISNPFPLGNIGDFDEANIVSGSRRRKKVDYAKMNDSLFGGLTPRKQKRMFGDEAAGWESPAKKKMKKKKKGGKKDDSDESDDSEDEEEDGEEEEEDGEDEDEEDESDDDSESD